MTARQTAMSLRCLVPVLAVCLSSSCASMRMGDRQTDRAFRDGEYQSAIERLKTGLAKVGDGKDQLLYLMDLGLVLHTAAEYQESIKYLLEAEKIADVKDYTSLASEGASLLTGENVKHYKGEDFEKILINVYLAMNFAMLGNRESALVEVRKVNRKLYLMITEGKRKYQLNAFAYYLAAILYEAEGEYDDAYIDYKRTYELLPQQESLGAALWRMAYLTRRSDEAKQWAQRFSLSTARLDALKQMHRPPTGQKALGEVVVLYQNGIAPIKKPHPNWYRVPKFFPRRNPVRSARVLVNGAAVGETEVFYDIESTAIRNLDDKWGGLIAKKMAGIIVKEATAAAVEKATDNKLLGFLTSFALHASDQADLRSWSLLPQDLQVLRIPLPAGEHEVELVPVGASGRQYRRKVQVQPGKKTFLTYRYVPD